MHKAQRGHKLSGVTKVVTPLNFVTPPSFSVTPPSCKPEGEVVEGEVKVEEGRSDLVVGGGFAYRAGLLAWSSRPEIDRLSALHMKMSRINISTAGVKPVISQLHVALFLCATQPPP
jgi:hypothetical protein